MFDVKDSIEDPKDNDSVDDSEAKDDVDDSVCEDEKDEEPDKRFRGLQFNCRSFSSNKWFRGFLFNRCFFTSFPLISFLPIFLLFFVLSFFRKRVVATFAFIVFRPDIFFSYMRLLYN